MMITEWTLGLVHDRTFCPKISERLDGVLELGPTPAGQD